MDRRSILKTAGLALAGTALLPFGSLANSEIRNDDSEEKNRFLPLTQNKRKLGNSLEVSSIGLGVQNMSRTYQTTIPYRPEMHQIIRKAFENNVTFFDAAEAYGPFEV